MKQLSGKEIKEIQLEILKSIHNFCSERNIRYSLAYGTLLGAVRHKGYIPWDDDVDIMMPRPDYERFIKEYPDFNNHYMVQTYINDESYYLAFAKVYDNRTEQIIFPTKTGVFVDVFPIDGIPENIAERDIYIKSKLTLVFKNILYTCKNNVFRPGNKIFNTIKYIVKRIMYPSRKQAIIKLNKLWNSNLFDSSKYAGVIVDVDALEHRGQVEREIFEKYITASFEGVEFKIIENYDIFLSSQYGDYMQLPPEEERVPGHAAPVYWKE